MKPLTYKALDNVHGLKAGHIYEACPTGARFHQFADIADRSTFTLYNHEMQHAVLRGELVIHDDTQSPAMHADVVTKLCQSTTDRYIY